MEIKGTGSCELFIGRGGIGDNTARSNKADCGFVITLPRKAYGCKCTCIPSHQFHGSLEDLRELLYILTELRVRLEDRVKNWGKDGQ